MIEAPESEAPTTEQLLVISEQIQKRAAEYARYSGLTDEEKGRAERLRTVSLGIQTTLEHPQRIDAILTNPPKMPKTMMRDFQIGVDIARGQALPEINFLGLTERFLPPVEETAKSLI